MNTKVMKKVYETIVELSCLQDEITQVLGGWLGKGEDYERQAKDKV